MMKARIKKTMRDRFGIDEFRPGQLELIQAILEGRDALAIMPTGSGKSLIYQLPSLRLRLLAVRQRSILPPSTRLAWTPIPATLR